MVKMFNYLMLFCNNILRCSRPIVFSKIMNNNRLKSFDNRKLPTIVVDKRLTIE